MGLSDILAANDGNELKKLWDSTEAAGELSPLPAGEYTAHIIDGKFDNSTRKGTPSYKLTFKILEGEHAGRLIWLDCWLTPAALPQTKRDFAKLGVTSFDQLEQSLPKYIRCKCKLALRRDDDGNERNRLKSFEVIGIDKPEVDPFAPGAAAAAANDPNPALPTAASSSESKPLTDGGDNA